MADLIYNPLLKKGFQEVSDTGSIEAEIDDLRQHKITKCLIPADLLSIEEGEIIQWQGLTQTIDNVQFVKGYFYIYKGETVTVQPPVNYLNFTTDFPLNHEYNLNDYNFTFGKYYKVKSLNINIANITEYSWTDLNGLYRFNSLEQIVLGTKVFDRQLNVFETVTSIDSVNYIATTDNNQTINISGTSTSTFETFWQTGNADGSKTFYILEPRSYMYYLLVDYDFETNMIKAWFPFQCLRQTQNTPYNYNTEAFSQTDTQPRLQNITNGSGGVVNITTDTNIAGDLTVSGTTSTVHAQEIESEADYIELRNGNPLGLANGERSGLEVNNYDGNGTDCILAVDNQGWARVGDSSGTLQKLATIEDNPLDAQFVQYDAQNKQLKTAAIPEATTTAAGLMSATDKKVINQLSSSFSIKDVSVPDYYCHLLADITDFWNSPSTTVNLPAQGFAGLAIRWRNGGNLNNNTANIVAMVSYQNNSAGDHRILKSSDSEMVPKIIEYQNRYYISLDFGRITAHTLFLFGKFIFCLDNDTFALQADCTVIV